MRIAIVTDAWAPQVNGVVRTLQALRGELERMGHEVLVVAPDGFPSMPCPTYPEIRLAFAPSARIGRMLERFGADAIHLATEGPLCLAARRWCLSRGLPFTTAYHTQFPDYVAARTPLPTSLVWRYIRWFHAPAQAVLASTPTIERTLRAHGLPQVRPWGRGVDRALFRPDGPRDDAMPALPRPVQLYVGRVAVEKNIEAFLASGRPGSKVVVGDGPALEGLRRRFPEVHFLGARSGEALGAAYRSADVFVFPSRTDTFGLVMAEALACGLPVAAYPVTGPADVVTEEVGALDDDLNAAVARALTRDRAACVEYARRFDWRASAEQFLAALAPVGEWRTAA
ncbi:glycosyltransferase family 4 protein [Sphingomonas lenta]|uniref:Alpha-mannosyltransferase n=1 Tax=Sphingomonas lenta TaxID=1141887 RepID=A0A2A2SH93_9SPHN|nr:glycosyltransferase family 1 protein [Sphingomonas lenta]PAX08401.1 alpha-mannosyltransferase [Sphingomonas lenta]